MDNVSLKSIFSEIVVDEYELYREIDYLLNSTAGGRTLKHPSKKNRPRYIDANGNIYQRKIDALWLVGKMGNDNREINYLIEPLKISDDTGNESYRYYNFMPVEDVFLKYHKELKEEQFAQAKIKIFSKWRSYKEKNGSWRFVPNEYYFSQEIASCDYPTWILVPSGSALSKQLKHEFKRYISNYHKTPNRRWEVAVPAEILKDLMLVCGIKEFNANIGNKFMEESNIVKSSISVDPEICGGRPFITGTRLGVNDIVEMIADGASREEILEDYPYISNEDITAALKYAANSLNHVTFRAA